MDTVAAASAASCRCVHAAARCWLLAGAFNALKIAGGHGRGHWNRPKSSYAKDRLTSSVSLLLPHELQLSGLHLRI